jgi:hypothetical protein
MFYRISKSKFRKKYYLKKILKILATLVASGREATGHLHEIPTGFMFYWGNLILVWVSLKSEIQSCDQSLEIEKKSN